MTSAIDTAGQDLRPPNEALIGPQWLAEHLDDPGLCVIEVDVSPADYSTGHIEGAALWNVYRDLKDTQYRTVDRAAIEALLGRSGIDTQSTVVFYGYAPALGFGCSSCMGTEMCAFWIAVGAHGRTPDCRGPPIYASRHPPGTCCPTTWHRYGPINRRSAPSSVTPAPPFWMSAPIWNFAANVSGRPADRNRVAGPAIFRTP